MCCVEPTTGIDGIFVTLLFEALQMNPLRSVVIQKNWLFSLSIHIGTSRSPVNGAIKGLSVSAMFVFDYHGVD